MKRRFVARSIALLTSREARQQVDAMRQMGMTAEFVEIDGGTHMSMIAPTMPKIFEFFQMHARQ